MRDLKKAQDFFRKLAHKQGITDPGGQGAVRYARLPNGFNTKSKYRLEDGSYPETRLTSWNPGVRYTPERLADLLGIKLGGGNTKGSLNETRKSKVERSIELHEVLQQLKDRNLYKGEIESGRHAITCPWVSEHTDEQDSGTVYFEPSGDYEIGGFKCHHGHCAHRTVKDLYNFLQVSIKPKRDLPTITILGGELHLVVKDAEKLLHEAGYFQNAGTIISVQRQQTAQGCVLSTTPMDPINAAIELTRLAIWEKWDMKSKKWIRVDAPPKYAQSVVSAQKRECLQPLVALARQPFLRQDGSLCRELGYDGESQLYADFTPQDFPFIPEQPSRLEAMAAIQLLEELVEESPFKSGADKSAALSMLLSAAVRPSLPTCPGFLINAHASGSGKSYLQDMAGLMATVDSPLPAAAFIPNEEEMRKELLAKLMESPAVIKWDEMKSDLLPAKALLSALSSERIEGRRLGQSQIIKVSTRTLMLFAGNNVFPVDDMRRRIIMINIDPQMEDPATREFRTDHLGDLRRHRGRYIMAALTVIRAWLMAGKPGAAGHPGTVNGYCEWSDWCRQPLLWLGYRDPASNMFDALKFDPAKDELERVMEAWNEVFGISPASSKDAVRKSESVECLRDALLDVAEGRPSEIDPRKLGYYLKRNLGRPLNGRQFELDDRFKRNSNSYRLGYTPEVTQRKESTPAAASGPAQTEWVEAVSTDEQRSHKGELSVSPAMQGGCARIQEGPGADNSPTHKTSNAKIAAQIGPVAIPAVKAFEV
jgi:hypothetical protein